MKVICTADSAELQEDYYRALVMGAMYWRMALMTPITFYNREPLSGNVTQFIRASNDLMSHIGKIMSSIFSLTIVYNNNALGASLEMAKLSNEELRKHSSHAVQNLIAVGNAGRQAWTQGLQEDMKLPGS